MLTQSIESVIQEAEGYAAFPLWTLAERARPTPAPRAVPFLWPYKPLRDLMLQASTFISAEQAKRRVFNFINPGTTGPCTTDTLYAGIQCILEGERAPAHRHTAFALRFILEGSGAYTSVEGERLWMEPGDLILTPSWHHHDHQKDSPGPMIWLDGLDLPLLQFTRIGFQEDWSPARLSLADAPSDTNLRFAWTDMRARLLGEPGPYARISYRQRHTGAPISRTIGAHAERLDPGTATPARRHTASHVYNVIAGRGRSRIADSVFEWRTGDTLAIPAWHAHSHENTGNETAYLFSYSDHPMLEALGLYREETHVAETPC